VSLSCCTSTSSLTLNPRGKNSVFKHATHRQRLAWARKAARTRAKCAKLAHLRDLKAARESTSAPALISERRPMPVDIRSAEAETSEIGTNPELLIVRNRFRSACRNPSRVKLVIKRRRRADTMRRRRRRHRKCYSRGIKTIRIGGRKRSWRSLVKQFGVKGAKKRWRGKKKYCGRCAAKRRKHCPKGRRRTHSRRKFHRKRRR
jgi:hypothetical protein